MEGADREGVYAGLIIGANARHAAGQGGAAHRCAISTVSTPPSVALLAAIADPPARGLARAVYDSVAPSAQFFDTLGLPEPLVHWGHPGNMAVVLAAMGFYGSGVLGSTIRWSDDAAAVAKAKDLHPKLAIGMGVFFSLGAVGGLMSLTMQGKSVLESPHAVTG